MREPVLASIATYGTMAADIPLHEAVHYATAKALGDSPIIDWSLPGVYTHLDSWQQSLAGLVPSLYEGIVGSYLLFDGFENKRYVEMGVGAGLLSVLAVGSFHDINLVFNDSGLEYLYGAGLLTAGRAAVYAKDKIAEYFSERNAHKVRVPRKFFKVRYSRNNGNV